MQKSVDAFMARIDDGLSAKAPEWTALDAYAAEATGIEPCSE